MPKAMPKANAETFPAHGNRHGSSAGVKFDFAYDLLSGEVAAYSLQAATEQDKTIGKEFVVIGQENDLLLRDTGYFSIAEFVEIERLGSYWLTRLPLTLGLRCESGQTLERLLKSHRGNIIDLPVKAGEAEKSCRLVAIRASGAVAKKRRKQRRKEAKAKGVEPDAMGLIRDGWHLMLTNLPVADFAPKQLRAIYRKFQGTQVSRDRLSVGETCPLESLQVQAFGEAKKFQGTGYLLGKPVPWNHFKFKRSARRREGRRMGAGESDSFVPIPLSHSFVPFLCPIPLSHSFVPFLCPIPLSHSFVPFLCPIPLSHSFVPFLCPDSSKAVMRHFPPRSRG